jgi:hypothetical protein
MRNYSAEVLNIKQEAVKVAGTDRDRLWFAHALVEGFFYERSRVGNGEFKQACLSGWFRLNDAAGYDVLCSLGPKKEGVMRGERGKAIYAEGAEAFLRLGVPCSPPPLVVSSSKHRPRRIFRHSPLVSIRCLTFPQSVWRSCGQAVSFLS